MRGYTLVRYSTPTRLVGDSLWLVHKRGGGNGQDRVRSFPMRAPIGGGLSGVPIGART